MAVIKKIHVLERPFPRVRRRVLLHALKRELKQLKAYKNKTQPGHTINFPLLDEFRNYLLSAALDNLGAKMVEDFIHLVGIGGADFE